MTLSARVAQIGLEQIGKPLRHGLVGRRGWIDLGDAPGMGYALDEDMLARTRTG